MLVKNELAGSYCKLVSSCCELVGGLDDDDIISTLALTISLNVGEAVVNYQMIFPAKAQG